MYVSIYARQVVYHYNLSACNTPSVEDINACHCVNATTDVIYRDGRNRIDASLFDVTFNVNSVGGGTVVLDRTSRYNMWSGDDLFTLHNPRDILCLWQDPKQAIPAHKGKLRPR